MFNNKCQGLEKQSGSVLVEYSIVTAGLVGILFLPMPGADISLIDIVLSALISFQSHTTTMMSLP